MYLYFIVIDQAYFSFDNLCNIILSFSTIKGSTPGVRRMVLQDLNQDSLLQLLRKSFSRTGMKEDQSIYTKLKPPYKNKLLNGKRK